MKELYEALLAAQKTLSGVAKNAENPFHKSKYADLQSILDTIKPVYNELGILIQQTNKPCDNGIIVVTELIHTETGETLQSELQLPLKDNNPQGAGSALTYARRYALACVAGLYQEDDDGNAASVTPAKQQPKSTPKPAAVSAKDQLKQIFINGGYKIADFQKLIGLSTIDGSTEEECQKALERYQSIEKGATRVK